MVGIAPHNVVRRNVLRVYHASRLHQLFERVQCFLVKVKHPCGFVCHYQRLLAQRVLRGYPRRALAGMAMLRLYAAQGKHKASRAVAPVRTQCHHPGNVKGTDYLARAANFDALAQARTAQRVVHQEQPFLQGRAHVVGELHRCRAGATFGTIHHNKVGRDARGQHGLDHGKPLPRVAYAQLHAGGLAARERAQSINKLHHFNRRGKRAVRCGRYAVHPHGHAARGRYLCGDLGAGQHAAVPGLGALAQFKLNHLHLRIACIGGKFVGIERAVLIAATKIA